MFSAFRTFLVIFLVLLQCVAPLVHAHAGERFFAVTSHDTGKLHIPGLEAYGDGYDRPRPGAEILQYCSAKLDAPSEGIVVGVDTGIKQNLHNDVADADHYYLPLPVIVFNAPMVLSAGTGPRSPPRLLIRYLFFPHSPHSPRAPPVL